MPSWPILVAPVLYSLAASITGDVNRRHRHLLAGGRNTQKHSSMGAVPGATRHHLVSFSDHILNREMEIGEGAAHHDGELFDAPFVQAAYREGQRGRRSRRR